MRAWTIDADDIQVAEDFDAKLLHRTPWIDEFLTQNRDDKFIITGTKGFGKTLLLKAKRVGYQESGGVLCLPENSLLDKPVGDKVFSAEMLELFGRSTDNWRKVWLISVAVAVLKRLGLVESLDVNPRLAALIADPSLQSVIDHFVNVLDFHRGDLFRSATDTDNRLVPRLRTISRPVAIFIDSIDEYFNKHIMSLESRSSDAGETSPNVWHLSQMALVETAYQLRRVSHHVKVFASVRKEAFSRLADSTPMAQQYRGSTIDISYSATSLKEIFLNNIRREKDRNLVDPSALRADPIAAFLGITQVTHVYTGQQEPLFDYIHRHTLARPRDLMTIGQKLSGIAPAERNEPVVKSAVNQAATEIAREYLNEISPYVGAVRLDSLFSLLPSNILTRDEVERLFRAHNQAVLGDAATAGAEQHVFCTLFKAGLLGYVGVDLVSSQRVQRFVMPGERTFDPDGVLPESTHYLVHPVLSEIISRANPKYVQNIDELNVVGNGRPWREADEERPLCVLHADIRAFSEIMDHPRLEDSVRQMLPVVVDRHASHCQLTEITGGDSLTIVHHDPNGLVKAAKRIMEDLFEAEGHPVLRVAIDYGNVRVNAQTPSGHTVRSGIPFRTAARLEPHVAPNEIWVTESFREALHRTPSFYDVVEVNGGEAPDGRWASGRLNIKKVGSSEPDSWVKVYRIVESKVGG